MNERDMSSSAMDYLELPLPHGLGHAVKLGWSLKVGGAPSDSFRHVVTPDGCMEIIRRLSGWSVWGVQQPPSFVAGITTAPVELKLGGGSSFIGIRLWPWAWNALAPLQSPSLVDRWMDLDLAAPGLALPATLEAMMKIVEPSLVDTPTRRLAEAIQTSPRVWELTARSGLSHRTLQRWFKCNVGVPPRCYLRLLRFQEALIGLQGKNGTSPITPPSMASPTRPTWPVSFA